MSNFFDQIFTRKISGVNHSPIALTDPLVPDRDSSIDLGSASHRIRNIYCNSIVQSSSSLDQSDVIWFAFNDSDFAIPLRFRYVSKSLAIVYHDSSDLVQPPPSGYTASAYFSQDNATNFVNLIPATPLWTKWEPKTHLMTSIPISDDEVASIGTITWLYSQSGNAFLRAFLPMNSLVFDFTNGFSYTYPLKSQGN